MNLRVGFTFSLRRGTPIVAGMNPTESPRLSVT